MLDQSLQSRERTNANAGKLEGVSDSSVSYLILCRGLGVGYWPDQSAGAGSGSGTD